MDNQRALYKYLSVSEANREKVGASLKESLNNNNQELVNTIAALKIIAKGKGVDSLFDFITELQAKELALQKEIIQLINDNEITKAASLMRTEYEPIFNKISNNVLQLFESANQDALNFIDEAQTGKWSAVLFGILLTVVMVAVSAISMMLYLKALIRPLKQVSGVAKKMAHGDLAVTD